MLQLHNDKSNLYMIFAPEQMPDESDEYFQYFILYIQLKNVELVRREIAQNKVYSTKHLYSIAKKFNWKDRLKKYTKNLTDYTLISFHTEIFDNKFKQMKNVLSLSSQLQDAFEDFIDYCSPKYKDSQIRQVYDFDDKLKRMKTILNINNQYINLTLKLDTLLEEYGIKKDINADYKSDIDLLDEFEDKLAELVDPEPINVNERTEIEETIIEEAEEVIKEERYYTKDELEEKAIKEMELNRYLSIFTDPNNDEISKDYDKLQESIEKFKNIWVN